MDVEDISPGQNFAQTIDHTMETCENILVVIGTKWRQILAEREKTAQVDYVRHEIESALARKIKIIPVFVGGATPEQLSALPAALADLPFHQAMTLHDESFKQDCDRLASSLGNKNKVIHTEIYWAAACLVALILLLSISKWGIHRFVGENQQEKALLATAETQTKLGEYEAAYRTCTEALKIAPTDKQALDRQANAAMIWLEHYSVLVPEDGKASDVAAPQLAELMRILDAGLARAGGKDSRSADILAHIGWAHWLNNHIAEKEFGKAAEQAYQQALQIAPANVYANSMLGNWLLQTHRSLKDVVQHFTTALNTGQKRPLVRRMQLGGMLYDDDNGVPQEAIRALNDMRKNNEVPDEGYKSRFLATLFEPNFSKEFLDNIEGAVPPEELWLTYVWLDDTPADSTKDAYRQAKLDYFRAKTLALEGKQNEASEDFRQLAARMKAQQIGGRLMEHIAEDLSIKK
jgi:tetratricopeptide (TPR) repeat protein